MCSPSSACAAGSVPARLRMCGKTLLPVLSTCRTTKTLTGRFGGSARTSVEIASTPPAEAPTTTMSCPLLASEAVRRLPSCARVHRNAHSMTLRHTPTGAGGVSQAPVHGDLGSLASAQNRHVVRERPHEHEAFATVRGLVPWLPLPS